jgi:miniconductance mechanosensitive channel
MKKLVRKSKNSGDDIFIRHLETSKLVYLVPLLIVYIYSSALLKQVPFLKDILFVFLVFLILKVISAALNGLNDLYNEVRDAKTKPIKGYIQITQIFIYIIGAIIVIGTLIDQPPLAILSGVGAFTAVILLIFRDTILSLVASIQISANQLIHVGDWIEMPRYGVDGDVIDIALHTVRVQNFDKTITTVPTYKFIEESFKNWRGMTESGGRRIKRAVHIDQHSIRHFSHKDLAELKKSKILRPYLEKQEQEIEAANKDLNNTHELERRQLTNIGTFRAYIQFYLENHPYIKNDFTLLVRQLQPSPTGLPIELYCFTTKTEWADYEVIQADIFDHILASVRLFDLKLYQQLQSA